MWEARIEAGRLDEFCAWAQCDVWPEFKKAQGFVGAELYRCDEQGLVVVVTKWNDSNAVVDGCEWFDSAAEPFCARAAKAWDFEVVSG